MQCFRNLRQYFITHKRLLIIIMCIAIGALIPVIIRISNNANKTTFSVGDNDYYLNGMFYGEYGGFLNPISIAVSSDGKIYLADSGRNQIVIMDAKGKEIKRIGKPGKEIGDLSYPVSLALDEVSGEILVAEIGNNRVQIFDLFGNPLGLFPFQSRIPIYPTAMTLDNHNNLYVVDKSSQEVLVFDHAGKLLSVIGQAQKAGFLFPMGLAVFRGSLMVSDSGNSIIKTYDSHGSQLAQIPSDGSSNLFNNPRGIAVDNDGNLFVADALRSVIMCFGTDRKLKGVLSVPDKYTPLFMPDGIAWAKGSLYVVDKGNGRVVKYTLM